MPTALTSRIVYRERKPPRGDRGVQEGRRAGPDLPHLQPSALSALSRRGPRTGTCHEDDKRRKHRLWRHRSRITPATLLDIATGAGTCWRDAARSCALTVTTLRRLCLNRGSGAHNRGAERPATRVKVHRQVRRGSRGRGAQSSRARRSAQSPDLPSGLMGGAYSNRLNLRPAAAESRCAVISGRGIGMGYPRFR